MVSKKEIKQMITTVRKCNGSLTLSYLPCKTVNSTHALYELYYGGWNKIEIGKYFRSSEHLEIKITDENLDNIVDKIYRLLSNCIGDFIIQAMDNLKLHNNELKYFDREPETYAKFKKEVLRLKKEKANE